MRDFVAAWNKVMNLDRYDLLAQARATAMSGGLSGHRQLNRVKAAFCCFQQFPSKAKLLKMRDLLRI